MATLLELLAKLDSNIQVRGHQFEHICKWYLENDPKYRLELKKIWLWKDWPGKWGPDAGIDLVGKTYDNKLWAIQSKAYDEKYSIKKTDIDTFLSESSRQVFSYRLLIASTNYIGRTALRTLDDQEKPVGRILFSDLQKSEVDWPESPQRLVSKPPPLKQPLPHQQKAISDVLKGFSEHDRGQLVMASGTGKTLVALWIYEKLKSQRTLILMPSLSLLAQTLREWTANTSQSFHYLPVCSDDTVRGEDRLISKTSDLGLPVTTDSREIALFLRQQGFLVVFATYQSSPMIAKAFTHDDVPEFDLAIADEAHRCAGLSTGPFAKILDSTAIKVRKRLFMTATPRYFTDRVYKEAEMEDFEIASMDDEIKFGPVLHKLSYSEAIRQDLLSDYQVVIIGVDNPTYRKYAQQGTFVTTDGKEVTDARTLASQIAVAKALRKYDLKRIVSFHSRVKRAKEFSEQLPYVIKWIPDNARPSGNIWSAHVSGEMPSGRRDVFLDHLRNLGIGERGLLANARCLAEGVDVPALDGIAFIDPRRSQIDIVQAVGRAIRKTANKKEAIIILPVFIDIGQDSKAALEGSVFKPIWDVLKALQAHDDLLLEGLDRVRRLLGRHGIKKPPLPHKIVIDLPIMLGETFVNSFVLKIVEKTTHSWQFWYGLLEREVEFDGDADVPRDYITEDGYKLGAWASNQQSAYRRGKLSKERKKLLEQLPGWLWKKKTSQIHLTWNKAFKILSEYIEHSGNTEIPGNYTSREGFKLVYWVSHQRAKYKQGTLSKDKQKKLEGLPGWQWDPVDARWQEGLKHLRKYAEHEGHTFIPKRYATEDGFKLGNWVIAQRVAFKREELTKERRKALRQIPGWAWDTHKGKWREGFEQLRNYVENEGHTDVPQNYVTKDGYKLGAWVMGQKAAYHRGTMLPGWKQLLEQLPDWASNTQSEYWKIGLKLLRDYVEHKGHTYVPYDHRTKDGFKLGSWIRYQRSCYRQDILAKERQRVLEQLPGWVWDINESHWLVGLKHLYEYIERKSRTYVPHGYKTNDGFKLGAWFRYQQRLYRRGILSEERQELLEQIPGWIWGIDESQWSMLEGLKRLRDYVENKGHTYVPLEYETSDGFKLGTWTNHLRACYRQGTVAKERQKLLEQIPEWEWNHLNAKWQAGLKYLSEYVEHTGHMNIRESYLTEDGYKLGNWVRYQQHLYRRGQLSEERQKALEEISGWTWQSNKTIKKLPPTTAGQ